MPRLNYSSMDKFYLKSMTAYGRGVAAFHYGRFTIEIQSVNRRHLEVSISLPRLFARFEVGIRKLVAAHIGRGALNVTVTWKTEGNQPVSVVPNLSLARSLKEAWEKLVMELGVKEDVPLSLLARQNDLFLYEEEIVNEEQYLQALNNAVTEALQALLVMKRHEGATLVHDLLKRLDQLTAEIVRIEALSVGGAEKYRQKLQGRLEEFFSGSQENEERILREVAIFAERMDITEEIVRFKSHLSQFANLVEKPLENEIETRGKTLDFLLQELLREINTVGSKASDAAIAHHVVTVKSELEKIREQVQNIE